MMNNLNESQLIADAKQCLDRSVENLELRVQSRLDNIRSEAMRSQRSNADSEDSQEPLVMSARVYLDDSVQNLEPKINQRLDDIRATVIQRASKAAKSEAKPTTGLVFSGFTQFLKSRQYAAPVGAFATACVLVTVVSLLYLGPGLSRDDGDILLFASADEIELYENLEFYQWLADTGLPD